MDSTVLLVLVGLAVTSMRGFFDEVGLPLLPLLPLVLLLLLGTGNLSNNRLLLSPVLPDVPSVNPVPVNTGIGGVVRFGGSSSSAVKSLNCLTLRKLPSGGVFTVPGTAFRDDTDGGSALGVTVRVCAVGGFRSTNVPPPKFGFAPGVYVGFFGEMLVEELLK